MERMFRLLRANEIDARVGNVKPNGISLLLYKDARCDQNILDETVGPFNWMRSHSRDNANCTVSIWDEKKQMWVCKEDTGTESKTEAEKGLASDSFKRACFNWGIGRELYSAPFIWISGKGDDLKNEKFTVTAIGYDENREINALQIINKAGNVVYKFGNVSGKYMIPAEPLPGDAMQAMEGVKANTDGADFRRKEWDDACVVCGVDDSQMKQIVKALQASGLCADKQIGKMTIPEFEAMISAAKANYGKKDNE